MMIVSIVALTHIEVDDDDGDGFKWNDQHLGHKIVRCEIEEKILTPVILDLWTAWMHIFKLNF